MNGQQADQLSLRSGGRVALRPKGRLLSWVFGFALAVTVFALATHWSEERNFARLLQRSRPGWLALAAAFQAATYLAQAGVWEVVLLRTRFRVGLWALYKMSVAKLFVDQAIPSAGISGTVLIVRGLGFRGVERGPVMACVVVETITNFTAFIVALLLALGLAAWLGAARAGVWIASAAFIAFAGGMAILLAVLSRGRRFRIPRLLGHLPGARTLLDALAEAPPDLAHRPRILLEATALNFVIHLLDAGTLWFLLRAVGEEAPITGVFAAFMLSTLARTLGVVPGGLGTFEAAAIGTLRLAGVPMPAALASTLLFRGFSFFVPIGPGLLLARTELHRQGRTTTRMTRLSEAGSTRTS